MMKLSKKAIIVPMLILSLLFLTACQKEAAQTIRGAYLGGTSGVVPVFEAFGVEESGVYSIFDEETFPLEVTIRNKGEYELKAGEVKVRLLGPSQEEFSGIPSWDLSNQEVIEAISELIPDGGENTFTFSSDAKYNKDVTGVIDREWFANVEYRYNTYLVVPEVCLKEDLNDDRVCDVKEAKQFSVSGAPITVKSVEEETAGKGIVALKIKVSNAGTGKVTLPNEDFSVRNTLSYALDDPAWECKSGGKVGEARLDELGQAEIVCKLNGALAAGHISTKQVKLTLDYKYRDLIQETLRIKQSS